MGLDTSQREHRLPGLHRRYRHAMSAWAGIIALSLAGLVRTAHAEQHLIRATDNLDQRLADAVPGDEFILWPGEYESIRRGSLRGTAEFPITIRGLDPENPPRFSGGSRGIAIDDVAHVRLINLSIAQSKLCGISLSSDEDGGDIKLEDITVSDTFGRAPRNAIQLTGVDGLSLNRIRIRGFNGIGLDLNECRNVTIEDLSVERTDPEIRGSASVRFGDGCKEVAWNRGQLRDAAEVGIVFGTPPVLADEDDGAGRQDEPGDAGTKLARPYGIDIQNVFCQRHDVSVVFAGAEVVSFTRCTVQEPKRVFVATLHVDEAVDACKDVIIGDSIFAWQGDPMTPLGIFATSECVAGIILNENLWWTPDLPSPAPDQLTWPGSVGFAQRIGPDPMLSEAGVSARPAAHAFGVSGPENAVSKSQKIDVAGVSPGE